MYVQLQTNPPPKRPNQRARASQSYLSKSATPQPGPSDLLLPSKGFTTTIDKESSLEGVDVDAPAEDFSTPSPQSGVTERPIRFSVARLAQDYDAQPEPTPNSRDIAPSATRKAPARSG